MLKRPHYIALGIVILLTLVLLKLPNRTAAQLKLAIGGLFLPIFSFFGSAQQLAENSGNMVVPRKELLRQLEQLQKENQELRIRSMQYEATAQENARLRQHFGWQKQTLWKLKLARVVARDPANLWRTIKIDLGQRDGVVNDSPVLTAEGLVGRVSEVGYSQSQVVLLGDPDCRVSVMIEDPPHEHGVIAPASSNPLDGTLVDLGYLSGSSKLKAGQRVVTSGSGGIFPAGIFVGHIADFRTIGYGLYKEARVSLAVKMNTLEEVFVKLPSEK
jgi:rod shape-determining protein MreC